MLQRGTNALSAIKLKELAFCREFCPLCDCSIQVRLNKDEIGVRCLCCGASAVTQSLATVIRQSCPDLDTLDIYELSAAGPLVRWLRKRSKSLTMSEFLPNDLMRRIKNPVEYQDVQKLTYLSDSFDLCTSTEVFEHVEDDATGFKELLRVLRPGGYLIFSVPFNGAEVTIERTELKDGRRVHVLPPDYHGDRYRGKTVLCYRNYGWDIVDRITAAGFCDVEIRQPSQILFGYARPIVQARKKV
jgi:SAM-dependent methyltransferase